jgi:hypothetical protein
MLVVQLQVQVVVEVEAEVIDEFVNQYLLMHLNFLNIEHKHHKVVHLVAKVQ